MASKKASVGARTQQFLASIGTAGGPIGSPSLVAFGISNIAQQIQAGNTDHFAAVRAMSNGTAVGDPRAMQAPMSPNLDASYLKLNLPGSPLPQHGLFTDRNVKATEITQDQMLASEQMMMSQMMPMRGQLPMGILPPAPQKKSNR